MRRQRVPFDWTVGDNVSAEDKTLQERADELKEQYRAMAGSKEVGALSMLPDNVESMVCTVS